MRISRVLSEQGALRQLHWISATSRRLRHVPFLQRAWLRFQAGQATKDVSAFVDGAIRCFPPPDQAVMRDPVFRPLIEESQTVAGPTASTASWPTTTPPSR